MSKEKKIKRIEAIEVVEDLLNNLLYSSEQMRYSKENAWYACSDTEAYKVTLTRLY